MPPYPDPDAVPDLLGAGVLGPRDVVLILSGPVSAGLPAARAARAEGDSEARIGAHDHARAATVARAEARGELVRLRAGVHVERSGWEAVSGRERHLLRIRALACASTTPVVIGGASAAAVHALPRIAPWPQLVTLLHVPGRAAARRSGTRVVRDPAGGRSPLVAAGGGVLLPALAATALAASHEAAMAAVREAAPRAPGWFAHGLVALDDALGASRPSPVTRAGLEAERMLRGPGPWSRRSALLVEAAEGAAHGPAESVARGVAAEIGMARPELGVHVEGHGRVALAWPGDRVGLRIAPATPPSVPAAVDRGQSCDPARWRMVDVTERDVLGSGRLRALLVHAGLEPVRRAGLASGRARSASGIGWPSSGPPLGCAGE